MMSAEHPEQSDPATRDERVVPFECSAQGTLTVQDERVALAGHPAQDERVALAGHPAQDERVALAGHPAHDERVALAEHSAQDERPLSSDPTQAFKSPHLIKQLLAHIEVLGAELHGQLGRKINIMEVCGSHTMAIAKGGFRELMPSNIKLISGPGCPVCVSSNADIDRIIALTKIPELTITTFGDMIRVPGSSTSLMKRKAEGADVQVLYSPLDALKLAQENPGSQVVFVGVGFETTTPLVAATILRAHAASAQNFSILSVHKRVPPALKALVEDAELKLDALMLPGHVSTILGVEPYAFLADKYRIPGVITGFEPVDIMLGIAAVLEQLRAGKSEIEIAYKRAVMSPGNPIANAAIERVFEVCDSDWRGLGQIADSGYHIKTPFERFDATKRFELKVEPTLEPRGCKCGEVLRGIISPNACPLFAKACTPTSPIGPCMVSSEGSCAAYFRYKIQD